MGKVIGFRVDANEHIASGHLMRCIAIASACIKKGNQCIFFLSEEKEIERLRQRKIEYYVLNSQWDKKEAELSVFISLLQRVKLDWLVVDSYQATSNYLRTLDEIVSVLYLDDMKNETYDVSTVLHYGGWPDDKTYLSVYKEKRTIALYGMRYVPLREEFCCNDEGDMERNNILITTGGTDPYNITERVLTELLERDACKNYMFQVIIGSMNSNKGELEKYRRNERVNLLYNVNNMGELMRKSRCAISAGGTTLFELCSCQVPTVCFSFADNQKVFVEEMGKRKIMLCAGDARENEHIIRCLAEGVERFVTNEDLSLEYQDNMKQLVDGKGASRIADFLLLHS